MTRLTEEARLARIRELKAALDAGEEPSLTVLEFNELFPPTLEQLRAAVNAAAVTKTLPT